MPRGLAPASTARVAVGGQPGRWRRGGGKARAIIAVGIYVAFTSHSRSSKLLVTAKMNCMDLVQPLLSSIRIWWVNTADLSSEQPHPVLILWDVVVVLELSSLPHALGESWSGKTWAAGGRSHGLAWCRGRVEWIAVTLSEQVPWPSGQAPRPRRGEIQSGAVRCI